MVFFEVATSCWERSMQSRAVFLFFCRRSTLSAIWRSRIWGLWVDLDLLVVMLLPEHPAANTPYQLLYAKNMICAASLSVEKTQTIACPRQRLPTGKL